MKLIGSTGILVAVILVGACEQRSDQPLDQVLHGDYASALQSWQMGKETPETQNYIGVMHYMGLGIPRRDAATAGKWFEQAAKQGYAPAQYNLGILYRNGDGVDQDLYKAFLWMHAANTQAHPGADKYLQAMTGLVGANIMRKARKEASPFIPDGGL